MNQGNHTQGVLYIVSDGTVNGTTVTFEGKVLGDELCKLRWFVSASTCPRAAYALRDNKKEGITHHVAPAHLELTSVNLRISTHADEVPLPDSSKLTISLPEGEDGWRPLGMVQCAKIDFTPNKADNVLSLELFLAIYNRG